jgi:predicted glycosyltransferase involved in capsule biosynthesis
MTLAVIIPVLNSHEVVRRQLLHWARIGLMDMAYHDMIQLIIVDDGSEPRLLDDFGSRPWVDIVTTGDTRPWTQPKARNIGANSTSADVLLFTDIDHILTPEAIDFAMDMPHDYGRFRRELGVLDEAGEFTQDRDVLESYGIPKSRGLRVSCHTLSMVIRREVFERTGGYREKVGHHPTHDDGDMKRKLKRLGVSKCPDDQRPPIYVFPNGRFCGDKDYNPMGLFHELERV